MQKNVKEEQIRFSFIATTFRFFEQKGTRFSLKKQNSEQYNQEVKSVRWIIGRFINYLVFAQTDHDWQKKSQFFEAISNEVNRRKTSLYDVLKDRTFIFSLFRTIILPNIFIVDRKLQYLPSDGKSRHDSIQGMFGDVLHVSTHFFPTKSEVHTFSTKGSPSRKKNTIGVTNAQLQERCITYLKYIVSEKEGLPIQLGLDEEFVIQILEKMAQEHKNLFLVSEFPYRVPNVQAEIQQRSRVLYEYLIYETLLFQWKNSVVFNSQVGKEKDKNSLSSKTREYIKQKFIELVKSAQALKNTSHIESEILLRSMDLFLNDEVFITTSEKYPSHFDLIYLWADYGFDQKLIEVLKKELP